MNSFLWQDRIGEGDSIIMNLQDKGVLDEEDDVLVNPNMIDDEKYEKVGLLLCTRYFFFLWQE